jgi:hypothetical protein
MSLVNTPDINSKAGEIVSNGQYISQIANKVSKELADESAAT